MLKRCQAASIISVTLDGHQRATAFQDAFWWRRFESVKQLEFADGEHGTSAFSFYKACPNLQVDHVQTFTDTMCVPCSSICAIGGITGALLPSMTYL